MLVFEALANHKTTNIACFFRTHMKFKGRKRFTGVAAKDPHYQAILQRIFRVEKAKDQGKLDHVLNANEGEMENNARIEITKDLKSKSLKTNARGQRVLNQDHGVDKLLFEKLEEYWADDKRVSHTVIFRTVLGIDPLFKVSRGVGGNGSKEHLQRLKQWFYFGFD